MQYRAGGATSGRSCVDLERLLFQTHEQIRLRRARKNIRTAAGLAHKKSKQANEAVVRDGQKRRAYMGGSIHLTRSMAGNAVTMRLHEIVTWTCEVLSIPWARVGGRLLWIRGIGTGNPFGRIGLSSTLVVEECRRAQEWIFNAPWWSHGDAQESMYSAILYVDDVDALSRRLCSRCLVKEVKRTHSVTFDLTGHGKMLPFCDLTSDTRRGHLRLVLKLKSSLRGGAKDYSPL